MKKLLAAGERRIFTLGHVFRNREQGPLHAAEFTMLEVVPGGEPYDRIIEDGLAILRLALRPRPRTRARIPRPALQSIPRCSPHHGC